MLTYLPGRVIDVQKETLTPAQLRSVAAWTRELHEAVAGFEHPGPWRYFPLEGTTIVGHNDIAPWNICLDGDEVAGVFDWDMAGPTTPLYELAFIAWSGVPLWSEIAAEVAAERLTAIADGYGTFDARQILTAVPDRVRAMFDWIQVAAAAGDEGMAKLVGGAKRSYARVDALVARIPAMERALGG